MNKKHLALKLLFRLLICVGSYWIAVALYPYNFYCDGVYLPDMTFGLAMKLFGLTAAWGAITCVVLLGLQAVGKWIFMTKNMLTYILYHAVFCTILPMIEVKFVGWFDVQPNEMFMLLGFIPTLLLAIVYSYERSHYRTDDVSPTEN